MTHSVQVCSTQVLGLPTETGLIPSSKPIVCYMADGTPGRVYSVQAVLPDGMSVYGLPDISAADVATISFAIAGVWAGAWIIRKCMDAF